MIRTPNADLNLTHCSADAPIDFGEGGSLWIRHIAFSRTALRSEIRDQVDGAQF